MIHLKQIKYFSVITFSTITVLLSACSSNDVDPKTQTSEALYQKAIDAYEKKDFEQATEDFKKLEQEFPFSRYTKDGLLKTAYAQFKTNEYDDASNTLKRYLEVYPGADNSDYVLYLLAMCYYNQIVDPSRDHSISLSAKKYLTELLNRYPGSDHSVDGQIKLDFVNNQIAAKEMIIGRFYLQNDQYPAAINRFKYVVKHYQTTVHIKEALHRLVESYLLLGLTKPAYEVAALLGHNYPESKWYHASYQLIRDINASFQPEKPISQTQADSWWQRIL
jgi:outer membrane protein assembly factor BamD